jgi:RimJ/RimL family protein N-acetyltransferase
MALCALPPSWKGRGTMTPALEAAGLRLIPYGAEHDVQTVAWLNDPELQRGFGLARKITLESHRAWLAANSSSLIWAIIGESHEHCGNVLLHPVATRRSAYLQIYLDATARGKSVASRALTSVLNYAFKDLGLHRIWLHTLPGNSDAETLYLKLGFMREGIEREALPRDQGFVDQFCWSLLEHEWRARAKERVR